jgi:hypothetical protein
VGRYDAEAISVQYCNRISNDWPPEYDCENGMTFKTCQQLQALKVRSGSRVGLYVPLSVGRAPQCPPLLAATIPFGCQGIGNLPTNWALSVMRATGPNARFQSLVEERRCPLWVIGGHECRARKCLLLAILRGARALMVAPFSTPVIGAAFAARAPLCHRESEPSEPVALS